MKHYVYLLLGLFFLFSCSQTEKHEENGAFSKAEVPAGEEYDLDRIQASGELIMATLSGPENYFDYHGRPMGLQYALAENFAAREGLRLRVEVAQDTAALFRLLSSDEADVAVVQLPERLLREKGFLAAGARDRKAATAWAVKRGAEALAAALDDWFSEGVNVAVEKEERVRMTERRQVRRQVRAPFISKEKGLISTYDDHFRAAARATGWDWRLIAAQCYQESGFDPNAVSWAGAKGLMQIMPATADHLGLPLERIYAPKENVDAAARYIKELSASFSDIRDREEKIKFVLAAYNGGYFHIRDAMALARKYGKNPHAWGDVSFFVRGLSLPKYYRDPVVKHGYMIGSETDGYVASIWERWRKYGGSASAFQGGFAAGAAQPAPERSDNRYTRGTKIYRPDDPEFSGIKTP